MLTKTAIKVSVLAMLFSPFFPAAGAWAAASINWSGKPDGQLWTQTVLTAIEANGDRLIGTMPVDMMSYCPNYSTFADGRKRLFWAQLFSALAHFESAYNPSTSFQESFKDNAGRYVISRGLLQISQESANGYGCGIKDSTTLHDPIVNLVCAVKIAQHWISRDGRIAGRTKAGKWVGLARYWHPLKSTQQVGMIKATLRRAPGCTD